MTVIIGRNTRSYPQQPGEREDGQAHFLELSFHNFALTS
jgi:hypothetical protein